MADRSEHIRTLLDRRLTRRRVLGGACELGALSLAVRRAWPAQGSESALGFARLAPSRRDAVIVPNGYASQTVLRWGDPLFEGADALDPATVAAGALL